MQLIELKRKVMDHTGVFQCVQIHRENNRKEVSFKHVMESPIRTEGLPNVGKLKEFYATFGALTLYHDQCSGDAAVAIASPAQWSALKSLFSGWLENLGDDEAEDLLPEWINDCLVIGEVPASGNYFLMPLKGDKAGYIYEFEHDGFEFTELATTLEAFVDQLLHPDRDMLIKFATYMRFIESNDLESQWWIAEMQDSFGRSISTESK